MSADVTLIEMKYKLNAEIASAVDREAATF
jgi:hypothetical protein